MFKTCVTILFSLSFPYAYGQDRDSTEVEHLITVLESAPSFKGDVKAMFHYIKKTYSILKVPEGTVYRELCLFHVGLSQVEEQLIIRLQKGSERI